MHYEDGEVIEDGEEDEGDEDVAKETPRKPGLDTEEGVGDEGDQDGDLLDLDIVDVDIDGPADAPTAEGTNKDADDSMEMAL